MPRSISAIAQSNQRGKSLTGKNPENTGGGDISKLQSEISTLTNERNAANAAKDAAVVERDAANTAKDAADTAKNAAIVERDAANTAKDAAIVERDAANTAKDAANTAKAAIEAEVTIATNQLSKVDIDYTKYKVSNPVDMTTLAYTTKVKTGSTVTIGADTIGRTYTKSGGGGGYMFPTNKTINVDRYSDYNFGSHCAIGPGCPYNGYRFRFGSHQYAQAFLLGDEALDTHDNFISGYSDPKWYFKVFFENYHGSSTGKIYENGSTTITAEIPHFDYRNYDLAWIINKNSTNGYYYLGLYRKTPESATWEAPLWTCNTPMTDEKYRNYCPQKTLGLYPMFHTVMDGFTITRMAFFSTDAHLTAPSLKHPAVSALVADYTTLSNNNFYNKYIAYHQSGLLGHLTNLSYHSLSQGKTFTTKGLSVPSNVSGVNAASDHFKYIDDSGNPNYVTFNDSTNSFTRQSSASVSQWKTGAVHLAYPRISRFFLDELAAIGISEIGVKFKTKGESKQGYRISVGVNPDICVADPHYGPVSKQAQNGSALGGGNTGSVTWTLYGSNQPSYASARQSNGIMQSNFNPTAAQIADRSFPTGAIERHTSYRLPNRTVVNSDYKALGSTWSDSDTMEFIIQTATPYYIKSGLQGSLAFSGENNNQSRSANCLDNVPWFPYGGSFCFDFNCTTENASDNTDCGISDIEVFTRTS